MTELVKNELELYSDYNIICGVDEAGRGPLAGPVVCSAVVFNLRELVKSKDKDVKFMLETLNDSKKISEKKREKLFPIIIKHASQFSIKAISPDTIDKLNILGATLHGMDKSIDYLSIKPDISLIDGNKLPPANRESSRSIIKGDSKYCSIAAASILAKVTRDRIMVVADREFPKYNWKKNKGYPTKEHIQMINEIGITRYHRLSFGPCNQTMLFI